MSQAKRDRWDRAVVWWTAGSLVAALGLLFGSWAMRSVGPWWSGVLANIGAPVLLVVPGALLAQRVVSGIRGVEKRADQAEGAARNAQSAAEAAAADVEVLSEAVERISGAAALESRIRGFQEDEHQEKLALYEAWAENADRPSVVQALRHAVESGLISTWGFRVGLFETRLHLRFRYLPADDALTLSVERANGAVVGAVEWPAHDLDGDSVVQVERVILNSGDHPSVGWSLSSVAMRTASNILRYAETKRAVRVIHGDHYNLLVQYTGSEPDDEDAWFITETRMFSRVRPSYTIELSRLGDLDWESHLHGRPLGDSAGALKVARALRDKLDDELGRSGTVE